LDANILWLVHTSSNYCELFISFVLGYGGDHLWTLWEDSWLLWTVEQQADGFAIAHVVMVCKLFDPQG